MIFFIEEICKMKYNNVKEIGIGDKVSYNNKVYTVLINYIKDDTD